MSKLGDFKYRWGKPIGESGWAVLREARDLAGKRVVVRQLRPDLRATDKVVAHFLGAAPQLVGVDHPHLVCVREVGELENRPFVVLEGRTGVPLRHILIAQEGERRPMRLRLARAILERVLRALVHGHGLTPPVFHGGLNAGCVWLSVEGHVRVDEFGMPRSLPDLSKDGGTLSTVESDLRAFGRLVMDILVLKRSLTPVAMQENLEKREEEGAAAWGILMLRVVGQDATPQFSSAQALLEAFEALPGGTATPEELARYVDNLTGEGIEATLVDPGSGTKRKPTSNSVHVPIIHTPSVQSWSPPPARAFREKQDWPARIRRRLQQAKFTFQTAPFPLQVGVVIAICTTVFALMVATLRGGKPSAVIVSTPKLRTIDEPPERPPLATKASRVKAPPLIAPSAAPKERKATKLAFGVVDRTASEGFLYVAKDRAALRSVAIGKGKLIARLSIGTEVEVLREMSTRRLIMILPEGPVGFINSEELVAEIPLEVLGRSMGYQPCRVEPEDLDGDCLSAAKERLDLCLDDCKNKEGTRCDAACMNGFDQCIEGCKSSEQNPPTKSPRRRRRGSRRSSR